MTTMLLGAIALLVVGVVFIFVAGAVGLVVGIIAVLAGAVMLYRELKARSTTT